MGRNVLGFLAAPDRELSLRAVSLALLKIRSLDDMTCEKLGNAVGCCADTIRGASNEENLLSLDCALRLMFLFPDESKPLRDLIDGPSEPPTFAERLERIERELDAIRKEAA